MPSPKVYGFFQKYSRLIMKVSSIQYSKTSYLCHYKNARCYSSSAGSHKYEEPFCVNEICQNFITVVKCITTILYNLCLKYVIMFITFIFNSSYAS